MDHVYKYFTTVFRMDFNVENPARFFLDRFICLFLSLLLYSGTIFSQESKLNEKESSHFHIVLQQVDGISGTNSPAVRYDKLTLLLARYISKDKNRKVKYGDTISIYFASGANPNKEKRDELNPSSPPVDSFFLAESTSVKIEKGKNILESFRDITPIQTGTRVVNPGVAIDSDWKYLAIKGINNIARKEPKKNHKVVILEEGRSSDNFQFEGVQPVSKFLQGKSPSELSLFYLGPEERLFQKVSIAKGLFTLSATGRHNKKSSEALSKAMDFVEKKEVKQNKIKYYRKSLEQSIEKIEKKIESLRIIQDDGDCIKRHKEVISLIDQMNKILESLKKQLENSNSKSN